MKMASRTLRAGIVMAISTMALATSNGTNAAERYVRAFGPLDGTDGATELSVVGQSFKLAANAEIMLDGRSVSQGSTVLAALASSHGATVAVLTDGTGQVATRLIVDTQRTYVPGSSEIVTAGLVRAVDRSVAVFWIGSARVDYAAILSSNPLFAVQIGDFVQVLGTRPLEASPILASRAEIVSSAAARNAGAVVTGITGSGINGITGSGINGITGSGINGITGSGITGITGSGNH